MTERRYLIVIEGAEGDNYSAYAPDLSGCVATADIAPLLGTNPRTRLTMAFGSGRTST